MEIGKSFFPRFNNGDDVKPARDSVCECGSTPAFFGSKWVWVRDTEVDALYTLIEGWMPEDIDFRFLLGEKRFTRSSMGARVMRKWYGGVRVAHGADEREVRGF